MKWSLIWDILASLFSWLRLRKKKPKRVLLLMVEDEPEDAELAIRALRRAGYECDWTTNGEEGLIMLAERKYSLVFVDLGLRTMGGWSLAKYIMEHFPATIVWIVTGQTYGAGEIEPGYAVGYLGKSIRYEAFIDAVKRSGL